VQRIKLYRPIILHDIVILYSNEVKNLGVIFDSSLSWFPHIKYISQKATGGIYSLNRSRNLIPSELMPQLATSLLFPYINYCDSVYQDCCAELSNKIQKLQNACVRFSCNLRKYDHVSQSYDLLKWNQFTDLRKIHLLRVVYQCVHNTVFPQINGRCFYFYLILMVERLDLKILLFQRYLFIE
jgi:hypothetical protein